MLIGKTLEEAKEIKNKEVVDAIRVTTNKNSLFCLRKSFDLNKNLHIIKGRGGAGW